MYGTPAEIPDLYLEVEEADARIIPHAMHAVRSGLQRIVIVWRHICIRSPYALLGYSSF